MSQIQPEQQAQKTLVFTDKYVQINLATLKATAHYENARGGLPVTRPVEHWQVIQTIKDLFLKIVGTEKYDLVEHPIFAYESSALRLNWPKEEDPTQCPVENYLLQRVLTMISFPQKNVANLEIEMAIAIGYHEKGIEVAFGPNIRVCSNQNIFGGKLMHTYGNRAQSVPWDKIVELVESWFFKFEDIQAADIATIDRLKSTQVDYAFIQRLLGEAYLRARGRNSGLYKEEWMSESLVGKLADFIYEKREEIKTAWDITQAGTNLLKPGNNDLMTMLKVNRNFNEFVLEAIA